MKFINNAIIMLAAMMISAVQASYSGTMEGCFTDLENFKYVGENPSGGYTLLSCSNQCNGYPLIALSGNKCYCGSAIPPASVKSDSSSCQKQCPLWSENTCGDSSVFIVYLLEGEYASTAAESDYASASKTGSSSDSSSSITSSSSSGASSSSPTSSASGSSSSSSSGDSSSTSSGASSSSSSATATSSSASSTSSATSSASSSGAALNGKKSSGGGISGGAIAGIVVGVVVGVLALVAAVVLFLMWKRRQNDDDVYTPDGSPTNFKSNMGGSFRDPYPPQPPRQLMDPRLNPAMLGDPRISIASLADARDYSRQILTVTNPDEKA